MSLKNSIAVLAVSWSTLAGAAEPERPAADGLCGSRCVHFVLRHNGVNREFIKVVQDLQYPAHMDGVSVAMMADYLHASGIHARSFVVSRLEDLQPRAPAIVHFKPTSQNASGHFVVLLPESTAQQARYWDGLNGVVGSDWSELNARSSGTAVLVSRTPIPDSLDSVSRTHYRSAAMTGLAVLAVWSVRRFFRRRSISKALE